MSTERVPAPIFYCRQESRNKYVLDLQYDQDGSVIRLTFKALTATEASRHVESLRHAYGWDLV